MGGVIGISEALLLGVRSLGVPLLGGLDRRCAGRSVA